MEPNIIVAYGSAGYFSAKKEIQAILTRIGDQKAEIELIIPGLIGIGTKIQSRKVIEDIRELYLADPEMFLATNEWTPADYWCKPTVVDVAKTIRDEVRDVLVHSDTYTIRITGTIDQDALLKSVVPYLSGKIDQERPLKVLSIHVFSDKACVSLLLQKDIFVR